MSDSIPLPQAIEEIDAEFLTAALAEGFPGTVVSDVTVADIRQGSASSLRLLLDYKVNDHQLPPSLFLKADFVDHDFAHPVAYANEALFFRHLAPGLPAPVNVPRGYFGGTDEDGQAVVLLEDLTLRRATFGNCEQPLDVDTVAAGVEQIAAYQAHYWGGAGLGGHPWLEAVNAVAMLMRYLVQPEHFDDYIARPRAEGLPAALTDRATVEKAVEAMFQADGALPTSLVHGDPHLGNTFLEPDGRLGFVDWQGVAIGAYIWDVTYFLTGALTVEDRRAAEADLLRLYLDRLAAAGVAAPGFDETFLAHRRHMMHGYLWILTPDQMQPDHFARAMGLRFAQAAEDLETLQAFD